MSQCKGIGIDIARSESLVSHVEKGKMVLLLENRREFAPLVLSRVNTCWVVCATTNGGGRSGVEQVWIFSYGYSRVEEHSATILSSFQVSTHSLEIQTDGFLVEILVTLDLEPRVLSDGSVVTP
jgi:hypothetical protein